MTEDVSKAIQNLKMYGYPENDPPSAQDIQNLIRWIEKLAIALSNECH